MNQWGKLVTWKVRALVHVSHLKMGITWYHIILVSLVTKATREKTNIR